MADTTKQLVDQSFFVFVKDTNTGRIRRMAIPADVQIGLQDNPAELQLLGRLSLAARDYSITSANQGTLYVASDDTIVSVTLVDTPTSGRITLYLPANPRNGQLHFVKDMSGTADSVPIDVIPSSGAKIDQFDQRTLTDKFGSIALYWFGDRWRILVAGSGTTSGGGADVDATYVTLSGNATLTNERRLNVSGTNLSMVDQGPNASVILDLSQILGGGAGTFTYATVTADAFGRITAISAGAAPPPNSASYITVTNEPGLSAERALVAGDGVRLLDAGSNSTITLSTPWMEGNSTILTTSSVTVGPGLGGDFSLLLTASNQLGLGVDGPGNLVGASIQLRPIGRSFWELLATGDTADQGPQKLNVRCLTTIVDMFTLLSGGQASFNNVSPDHVGRDVWFFVSGTVGVPSGGINARRVAVFGGDVQVSGSITVGSGSSRLTGNDLQFGGLDTRIEKAGADLKFYDINNPSGHTLSSLVGGGSGGGADVEASYVTIGNTGSLPNERRLVAGSGINITDYGPGTSVVVSATGSGSNGQFFSAPILAGTTTTNTATSGSKQSIGAFYFNPTIINSFSGTRNYFWRAIVDTSEALVSVAVDLYDIDGIVGFPPGIITGSIMSSSNLMMTQLTANLTSQLQNVTGSGIIEARLWKTVSGSLTSSVTCRNARLDVEFT